MSLTHNTSNLDRIVRLVLAVVFFALAFMVFQDVLTWIFVALAVVMLVTAAVGFCPLYRLFGISTAPKEK